MNELKELLKFHYNLYPKMQIKDAVKLIYQNEFGGGHIIKDENASLEYLIEELTAQDNANANGNANINLFDEIGNGVVRINLAALKSCAITPATINKLFVLSANNIKGNKQSFKEKLNLLYELPFDKAEIDMCLSKYREAGYPMVNHSDVYRKNYNPSYRVIDKKYIKLFDLFNMIDKKSNKKIIVGIDGKCGSGKSTIGAIVHDVYECDVIHMDDFFLPPELRTDERLNEAGGNVHYERFKDEVAVKIKSSGQFKYRIFDCSIMNYKGKSTIQSRPQDIIIVEGSYSLHPKYSSIYDIKVFIEITNDIQKQRITSRDGEMMWEKFENIWIPMENKYFNEFHIKDNCDIVVEGT